MKKIKLLLIPLFAAFAMPAISQHLYIYNTGNDAPKLLFDDVRKISINAYEMGVELKMGARISSHFQHLIFSHSHLSILLHLLMR